ncbi:MAG: hypothetical protein SWH54_17595 [Thermodesulfobacteriota bacterium]|nr:hypothetical protein [Thermodesulfobacteriota bacterium]
MSKRRYLPSMLMIIGFILLVLSAIALPSASENSRFIVTVFALSSVGLIVAGVILGFKSRDAKNT